ncbi:MAG: Cell division protein FtsA [Alphaproteobacteria bacterium MarineAlpha4_Bin2]|nr:MAG: Cell division protein FtsA [Alphaproteobacteria bacterium MarineAlpha4_Bin2]
MARSEHIAALDIGTTKVCCFVAEREAGDRVRVVGIGHHVSEGVKAGTIVDMQKAEQSVLAAVHAAEQMAGTTIREVIVNVSSGEPSSQYVDINTDLSSQAVGDRELGRLFNDEKLSGLASVRHLVHAIPIGYEIDGSNGIRDPRGLYGHKLGVRLHAVTAESVVLQNVVNCVERCHLGLANFAVNPYAAGAASVVEDELDLGVTIIDMGGGTTSIGIFFEGALVHVDSLPIGGNHITNDIARGLSTPMQHAERLKTLHGTCLPSPMDESEIVSVPRVGEDDDAQVPTIPKSFLVSIIAPRIEETLELVRYRLAASGLDRKAGRRVVLTGGASQLPGVRELAGQLLDKQTRMGRPIKVSGLAEATCGPAFSVCAGLLSLAVDDRGEAWPPPPLETPKAHRVFGKLGGWLRANF